MTTARFSMRLESELKDWLEEEAKRHDRSAGYIAVQAIKNMKEAKERKRQMIEEAIVEAGKGVFISEEKMTEWFLSLGTDNELPEPKPDVFLKPQK